jgi:hypothetical protein
VQQTRRALDVREEERDGAARQFAHASIMLRAKRRRYVRGRALRVG